MRNYAEIKAKTLDYYGIDKKMPDNKLVIYTIDTHALGRANFFVSELRFLRETRE